VDLASYSIGFTIVYGLNAYLLIGRHSFVSGDEAANAEQWIGPEAEKIHG
jgi:hypothetical protein